MPKTDVIYIVGIPRQLFSRFFLLFLHFLQAEGSGKDRICCYQDYIEAVRGSEVWQGRCRQQHCSGGWVGGEAQVQGAAVGQEGVHADLAGNCSDSTRQYFKTRMHTYVNLLSH